MSVNTVPRFIEQPRSWAIAMPASTPRATEAGGGTLVELVSAGTHGSKVDQYIFTGEGEIAASRLFIFLQTAGGTNHLLQELAVAATSAGSAGVVGFSVEHVPTNPHLVPSGWSVQVGSAETTNIFNAFAIGGDY